MRTIYRPRISLVGLSIGFIVAWSVLSSSAESEWIAINDIQIINQILKNGAGSIFSVYRMDLKKTVTYKALQISESTNAGVLNAEVVEFEMTPRRAPLADRSTDSIKPIEGYFERSKDQLPPDTIKPLSDSNLPKDENKIKVQWSEGIESAIVNGVLTALFKTPQIIDFQNESIQIYQEAIRREKLSQARLQSLRAALADQICLWNATCVESVESLCYDSAPDNPTINCRRR